MEPTVPPPREESSPDRAAREVFLCALGDRAREEPRPTELKVCVVAGLGGTATTVRSRFRAMDDGAVCSPDGPLPRKLSARGNDGEATGESAFFDCQFLRKAKMSRFKNEEADESDVSTIALSRESNLTGKSWVPSARSERLRAVVRAIF